MNKERINIGIILRMATSLIPLFLGMPTIATILCAYNIAMTFVVCGPISSIISGLGAVIISALFGGFLMPDGELYGLVIGIEAVLCAAAAIYAVVKNIGFFRGVWLASAGHLIPSFIYTYVLASKNGESVVGYMVSQPIKMLTESVKPALEEAASGIAAFDEIIEIVQNVTSMILPSVFMISSIVVGYIVMWAFNAGLRRAPIGYKHSFSTLIVPKSVVIVMLAALVLELTINTKLEYVFVNVFVIMGGLCFFSGLSLVEYFLRKKFKNAFGRIVIHFVIYSVLSGLILFIPFANYFTLYILIGAIDAFVDFRKITKKQKEGEAREAEE